MSRIFHAFSPQRILLSVFMLACLVCGGRTFAEDAANVVNDPDALRNLAAQRGIAIGAAVNSFNLSDMTYAATLAGNFNMIVAENEMKFDASEPQQNSFNFVAGDKLAEFARQNQMTFRGHCLVWHQQLPEWLTSGKWSKSELLEIMRNHIKGMVGHYRGKVACWDVVNEAIDDNSGMRNTLWYSTIGKSYIDEAFIAAREADPDVLLFYNDYGGEGLTDKANAIYQMVKGMKKRGIPIDGVGMQMHIDDSGYPMNNGFKKNIERLTALGLKVQITELDVRLQTPTSAASLEKQARIYHDLMVICLQNPNVTAVLTWGLTDRYSWIPNYAPMWKGTGKPLLFDADFNKKPAYFGVQNALKGL